MKRYLPQLKALLSARGLSYEYSPACSFLVCSAADAYGLVMHVFRATSGFLEISTVHSQCVEEHFLFEAEQIIREANRGLARGEFLLSENGTIILLTLYREEPPEGPSLQEVCREAFDTGNTCRRDIFENMFAGRDM